MINPHPLLQPNTVKGFRNTTRRLLVYISLYGITVSIPNRKTNSLSINKQFTIEVYS